MTKTRKPVEVGVYFSVTGKLMTPWAGELRRILNQDDFAQKRADLRHHAHEILRTHHKVGDDGVEGVYAASPLIGGGDAQINPPATLAGLRDALSMRALLQICFYNKGWTMVIDAMVVPAKRGVKSAKGKTGYALGESVSMAGTAIVKEYLLDLLTGDTESSEVPETKPEPVTIKVSLPSHIIGLAALYACDVQGRGHISEAPSAGEMRVLMKKVINAFCKHLEETSFHALSKRASEWVHGVYDPKMYQVWLDADEGLIALSVEKTLNDTGIERDAIAGVLHDALDETTKTTTHTTTEEDTDMAKTDVDVDVREFTELTLPTDESVVKLVDMTLSAASMPSLKTLVVAVNGLEAALRKAKGDAEKARQEAREAAEKAVSAPALGIMKPSDKVHVESVSGAVPKGHWMVKPACEVFGVEAGADTFRFDVPVWTWEGEHPDVPHVNQDYVFRPFELFRVLTSIVGNKRMYLHGDTGSGKTTLVEQVAAKMHWPFMRLNMDSDITRDMLIGKDELIVQDGVTVSRFLEGLLPKMIGGPVIGCLDEFDFGRPDIMYAMQSVLEGNGLRILEDGGRIVKPNGMSRLFATGNTVGQGDEKGMYQGARQQSLALLDRFERWMEVKYLAPEDRMKLIEKAAPALDKGLRGKVGAYVTEHLQAFKDATVLQPITPRGYMDLAELLHVYSTYWPKDQRGKAVEEAVSTSVLDRATQQDRAVLAGIAQRVFDY